MGRAKLANLMVAFTLVCTIGGHWALPQSLAWLGMLVTYSQEVPLSEALRKTFDGDHPCQMCKAVQQGKKAEQQQASFKFPPKLEFYLNRPAVTFLLPDIEKHSTGFELSLQPRSDPPPVPPPRRA